MNRPKTIIATLLAAASLAGCIGEDLDNCPPVEPPVQRLTFRYTHNVANENRIAGSVEGIGLYVFDHATGLLVDTLAIGRIEVARGSVDVEMLPEGDYTFVAWGTGGPDGNRHYSARHMVDAENHRHDDVEIGVTTIDDLWMMLDSEPVTRADGIAPAMGLFDDLFWAAAEGVNLTRTENTTVEFDFIRNTSVLKVSVTGLEHLDDLMAERGARTDKRAGAKTRAGSDPLVIFATGENGRYRWDNTIDEWAPAIEYPSSNHSVTDASMAVDVKTLRLHKVRHDITDPVLLHIVDSESGEPIFEPLDLVTEIGRIRNDNGSRRYPDQEAIDREEEFRINVAIEPVEPGGPGPDPDPDKSVIVTIQINGWEVIRLDPKVED
jgi:hypothetical protein